MNDIIFARVKTFVAKHAAIAQEKLKLDTRLLEDLGIDGADGVELIEAFCKAFEIKDMKYINISEYFYPEGDLLIWSLYCLLFDRKKLRKTPITLRDLAESAEAKRWIPPKAIA